VQQLADKLANAIRGLIAKQQNFGLVSARHMMHERLVVRFATILLLAIAALTFGGCATDSATEELRRENAGIPGATPSPPPLNEHGGISW
jgi:hypothetical protein